MCVTKFTMCYSATRTFIYEHRHVCVGYTTSLHNCTQLYHQDNNIIISHTTEYFIRKHFMLIFTFWCQMSKCAALQGKRFIFLTRQQMCQPITAFLLQQCWGFFLLFFFNREGVRVCMEKFNSSI
jgi:hypothetical protein